MMTQELDAMGAQASRPGRVGSWGLVAVAAAMAGWIGWQATAMIGAEWASGLPKERLADWARQGAVSSAVDTNWQAQWVQVHEGLMSAAALTPQDAFLQDYLGAAWAYRGLHHWPDEALRVQAYERALGHQMASLALRPNHALAWANVAQSRYALGMGPEAVADAWRRALALGAHELDVQLVLMGVVAAMDKQAPAPMRAWAWAVRDGSKVPAHRRQMDALLKSVRP
jgi:hypothetical protein